MKWIVMILFSLWLETKNNIARNQFDIVSGDLERLLGRQPANLPVTELNTENLGVRESLIKHYN